MNKKLFFPAWFYILKAVDDNSKSDIRRITDLTYCHVVLIINELEKEGFLKQKTEGRLKIVSLTVIGKRYRDIFREIMK